MKSLVVFSLLMLLLISTLSIILQASAQNKDFITYGKSVFGLSIKHPSNWAVVEEARSVPDGRVGKDYFVVMCPEASQVSTEPGSCYGKQCLCSRHCQLHSTKYVTR